jgi:hypothetical protein
MMPPVWESVCFFPRAATFRATLVDSRKSSALNGFLPARFERFFALLGIRWDSLRSAHRSTGPQRHDQNPVVCSSEQICSLAFSKMLPWMK